VELDDIGHKCVFVICAHSDDEIIGPGGTIAKMAKDGAKVFTFIMSYGELTPAWIKHKHTIETRTHEAEKADKIVGGSGVHFFGLKEGSFTKEAEEKDVVKQLKAYIKKEKPTLIFTHIKEDPHRDHKDTLEIVKRSVIESKHKPGVYSFGIWNPLQIHRRAPHLVVDISDTFKTKMKALDVFKSQHLVILLLMPGIISRAKFQGFMKGYRYAETFRRVLL
jgi:LmbE family N-acetylglucosaminyl deacetylase